MDLHGFSWIYVDLGGSGARGFGFRWIYMDLVEFQWICVDLGGFRRIWGQEVCRPVASCGTGVVAPKERLLQSQTAVSEAWRPVDCRLGGWD